MTRSAMPLSRFTVLDLTRVRAGPTAVRRLADRRADIVRIEVPAVLDKAEGMGGARHGPDFRNFHRNKRAVAPNPKDPDGRADLRIAAEDSRFGIPAAKLGVGHSYGGLRPLVDPVGPANAKEIPFTARRFTAPRGVADGAREPGLAARRDRRLRR